MNSEAALLGAARAALDLHRGRMTMPCPPLRLLGTQKSRYGRVQARGILIPGAGETRPTVADIVFDTT